MSHDNFYLKPCSLTLSQIWREEGWRGFWRGFGTCSLRAFPTNAAGFLAFESSAAVMRKWEAERAMRLKVLEQEEEQEALLRQQRAEKEARREQHRRQRIREREIKQRLSRGHAQAELDVLKAP